MIINTPSQMLYNSVLILISGFVLTLVLDLLTLYLEELSDKAKSLILFVKDIIFALIYSLSFVLLIYYFANGAFRFVYLVSLFLGYLMYYSVFQKVVRKLTKILMKPLELLFLYILKIIRKIYVFLLHTLEKIELRLYNNNKN